MAFIIGQALPRRTVLRGLGASLSLPLLDAMLPAFSTRARAATTAHRFLAFYVPNGMAMEYWTPKGEGRDFELSPILEPLAPFKNQMLVFDELQKGTDPKAIIELLSADPSFQSRQFGILEIHGDDRDKLLAAGRAVLAGMQLTEGDQLAPRILFTDVIEDIADQHAVIINRNRQASMILPGETLLVCEMVPALFAAVAANEAEKVAPENTLVDVQMIGAAGRLYISGRNSGIHRAKDRIAAALEAIESRAQ